MAPGCLAILDGDHDDEPVELGKVLYVRTNYGKAISTYIDNIDNLPPRGTVQQGRSSPPINDAHWKAKMMQNKPKDSTGSWLSAR